MRIAAIDFGLKRIGLAISDERLVMALPLKVVPAGKTLQESADNVWQALNDYRQSLTRLIVGLPLLFSGAEGEIAKIVREFGTLLKEKSHCEIIYFDERLTSAMAEKAFKSQQISRKKRKGLVDPAAACILLQDYLTSIKNA